MIPVRAGQRWINHARPELGLGMVIATEGRTVTMRFGEDGQDHVFALESAPLSRIRFAPGDVVRTVDGARVVIDGVEEREGIFVYTGADGGGACVRIPETVIAPNQSFNRPAERLLHGQIDEDRWFALRYRTLANRHRLLGDPLWGLTGGRTAWLRHQLYVAREVAHRHAPRVLLADEVGLGKTIEAGLVVHAQLVTERIRRVLIVVPESLLFQWLVEMLRRFNLSFSIFDASRCEAMDPAADASMVAAPRRNPFLEEQLVLVGREFLVGEPARLAQCAAAAFDMLVVDEAHHLHRADGPAGNAYRAVEALAAAIPSVLLLTGTPRQLGASGHFSRLRLLDPARYHDPMQLEREHREFEPLADLVEALDAGRPLTATEATLLNRFDVEAGADAASDGAAEQDERRRERLIDRLLDRFGTGRVMFRNTRASVSGFPRRCLEVHRLDRAEPADATGLDRSLDREEARIATGRADLGMQGDPRLAWLATWLGQRPEDKALVICSSRVVATSLAEVLKNRHGIRCASFHEGLSLIERDRAAAWFADPVESCQVLVCSEIGSEGRNFQFAHHLVLFDLPETPDLLEQRIGRLDRIGRRGDVLVHVPCVSGSAEERLLGWYHEGLDAFESVGTVNQLVYEQVASRLPHALEHGGKVLESLIAESRTLRQRFEAEMRAGRDRLLEFHSLRPGQAERLVEEAQRADQDRALRDWFEYALACYDINMEAYRSHSVVLTPGERLPTPIPGLPEAGLAATFDRGTALENEDLAFLTFEHPLVQAIGDLVLNTERGNATLCGLRHSALPRGRMALESVFVVEAPLFSRPELMCYVPPLLVAEIRDEGGRRLEPSLDHEAVNASWVPLKYKASRQIVEIKRDALKRMLDTARDDIVARAPALLRHHGQGGLERLSEELARLRHLRAVNPNVRQDEIDHYEQMLDAVRKSLAEPRVRLDALRVIVGL